MHYGTNQKFGGGAWARFGGPVPPWPQPKTATGILVGIYINSKGNLQLEDIVTVQILCSGKSQRKKKDFIEIDAAEDCSHGALQQL